MKRFLSGLMAVLLVCAFASGCSDTSSKKSKVRSKDKDRSSETVKITETEGPDGDLLEIETNGNPLFYAEHTNYSEGYQDSLFVIMDNGDLYKCYGWDGGFGTDGYPIDKLDHLLAYTIPYGRLESEYLRWLYTEAMSIDRDAELIEENVGYDMGQTMDYCIDQNTGAQFFCLETGSNESTYDDPHAEKFKELWTKIGEHIEYPELPVDIVDLFTYETRFDTLECKDLKLDPNAGGKYYFEDWDVFKRKAEEWNIDMGKISYLFEEEYYSGVIFVQFESAPVGSDPYRDALMTHADRFTLLPSLDYYYIAPSGEKTTYVSIAVFPGAVIDENIYTESGEQWELVSK
ncbi:MAG: hypothetical protein J6U54_10420 [Clostridiales bacterium]|nr:hypothetical protein [Clostridiales bacterium]